MMIEDNSQDSFEDIEEFDTRLDISERDSYSSYLSICYQDNKLGVAFYRCGHFVFQLLHETYEYGDFSVLKATIQKLQPSLVMVSSKIKANLFRFLKKYSNNSNDRLNTNKDTQNSQDTQNSENNTLLEISTFKIIVVPKVDFDYERSKSKIMSLPIEEKDMDDYQQRFIFLSSFIDFQEQTTIKAFGALLHILDKELSFEESSRIKSTRDDLCFNFFNVGYVVMNKNSYEALEIFQEEWHPSVSKRFYKKEGVSLYGLFNNCQSKLGSFQLRQIFQQPTSDVEILLQRQSLISYFLELNDVIRSDLLESLKVLKDIDSSYKNFRSYNYKLQDFQLYSKNFEGLSQLRKIVSNLKSSFKNRFNYECNIFKEFFYSISDEAIHEMNHLIKLLINFEASNRVNKIQLMNGIDETLDELKQKFNSLPDLLREKMIKDREVNYVINQYFDQIRYIYIPQMGFFVRIETEISQSIRNLRNYGFEVIFCANKYAFFKNQRMREFDKEFGDLNSKILDRTNEVLAWLADTLCEDSIALRNCLFIAGKIDSALAMAQAAKDFKLIQPVLTASGSLKICQGRHLIYEAINGHHVPNDFFSDDETKINILYSTNGAGKSVFIKQNALIVYMAHIGSFVPANSAEIPLIDQIFTRIKTLESISTQLSAFKADLNQVISATKFAEKRSFVVFDTFGKGTLSTDAIGLLIASINYFSETLRPPHLLISCQFDLTQCMSFFKCPNRIRFLKFYFRNKKSTFRIRNMESDPYYDDEEDEEEAIQSGIPKSLTDRQNDFLNNNDSFDLERRFPGLDLKYRKFLSLAEHCLNVKNDVEAQNIGRLLSETLNLRINMAD